MTYAEEYKRCHCEVCKAHRNDPAHSRKYGYEHYEACMCDRCVKIYNEHNRQKMCACDDCVSHRAYLYNKHKMRYANAAQTGRKVKVATVNLCERCGAMATSTAMGVMQYWDSPNAGSTQPAVELCPGCVGELHAFMAGEPVSVGDRPKNGYRKPWEAPKSSLADVSTEDLAKALLSRQLESGGTGD